MVAQARRTAAAVLDAFPVCAVLVPQSNFQNHCMTAHPEIFIDDADVPAFLGHMPMQHGQFTADVLLPLPPPPPPLPERAHPPRPEQPSPSGASHAGASGSDGAGAGTGGSDEAPPDRYCAICMDYAARGQQARLLPCCHACLCAGCATMLVRRQHACPICRQPVRAVKVGVFEETFAKYPALGQAGAGASAAGGGRAGERRRGRGR
ncbi:hypothetical protein T492DRAFT_81318 [Pavlovales sp. CCMP2436]|nr:hypothetical protein T492DRAFT_81318 [Pavlovales sp. CCMP2436]